MRLPHFHAALLAATMLAAPALAQAPSPPSPPPAAPTPPQAGQGPATIGERAERVLNTVIGNPLARAETDMARVIDAMADLNPQPIEKLSPEEARKQPSAADGLKALLRKEGKSDAPEPGVTAKDVTYAAAAGEQPARIYTPDGASGPLPVVLYFHGGGFVIANIETYDAAPRAIAKQANAVVVSVEYRHAPEAKLPAAHEDAVAAYKWVLANAGSFGGDPGRVALLGESAGGNLAINTAIAARDQGLQRPLYEVLVYPMAGVDMDTQSYKDNSNAKPLNKDMMAWFMGHVVKDDADRSSPLLDVIGRAEVKDLPPTTIITAGIDPLHDDGVKLGDKLKAAGVTVRMQDYPGATHEFFGMGAAVAAAKSAQAVVAQDLRTAFASASTGTAPREAPARPEPVTVPGPAPAIAPPPSSAPPAIMPPTPPPARQP